MAKPKELVVAVFEKPTECRECPCYSGSDRYLDDYCDLANKRLTDAWMGDAPIPDWCPLTDVKFVPG